jgi:hypothetical protein
LYLEVNLKPSKALPGSPGDRGAFLLPAEVCYHGEEEWDTNKAGFPSCFFNCVHNLKLHPLGLPAVSYKPGTDRSDTKSTTLKMTNTQNEDCHPLKALKMPIP